MLLFITFMQGISNYIPETNHVSRVYSVAAVLRLQFTVHVMLRPTTNVLNLLLLLLLLLLRVYVFLLFWYVALRWQACKLTNRTVYIKNQRDATWQYVY